MYPNRYQSKSVLGCSRDYLQRTILPGLYYLADVIDEIYWEDRLDPRNHAPHFPFLFTGIVDTFPMRVCCPTDGELAKSLYNPKYKHYVYKGQLGIDFLGK